VARIAKQNQLAIRVNPRRQWVSVNQFPLKGRRNQINELLDTVTRGHQRKNGTTTQFTDVVFHPL